MTTTDNGVNVQALLDAREVLKGAPEAAQFTWRASSTWQNGVHSTVKVQNFFGLGEEQTHKTESTFDADHPAVFAAEDNGITPIEYLLVGLTSCLSAGVASVAQNRGIQLRSVESTVEGHHDIRGILGAGSDAPNAGTAGRLQAPLAITTARLRKEPRSVATSYPSSVRRTETTVVPVRTGARERAAKPSMNAATSPLVRYPSGSGPA